MKNSNIKFLYLKFNERSMIFDKITDIIIESNDSDVYEEVTKKTIQYLLLEFV